MPEEGTSEYWRNLLKIDEPACDGKLVKFKLHHRIFRPIFFLIFHLLARFYLRIEVHGKENIPKEGAYILAPNHSSSLDYPIASWAIGKGQRAKLHVLATKYFYDNPVAGFFIRSYANTVRIDTEDDFFTALRTAVRVLKLDKPIYIHPEGTRTEIGELLPFKVGVGVLAYELNVPIIPMYISGAFEALPSGSILPLPNKIKVFIGKPLMMDQFKTDKGKEEGYYLYKKITDELFKRMEELKDKSLG